MFPTTDTENQHLSANNWNIASALMDACKEIDTLKKQLEQLQGMPAFKCGKADGLRFALSILMGGAEKQKCIELIVDYLKGDEKWK